MIRVRSFCEGIPLLDMDVQTGSNRMAVQEAAQRASEYGSWEDVQINFNDGSRPLRGAELLAWVSRHFPQVL